MYTFYVTTVAPRGPRSKTTEQFIVVAMDEAHARCQAVAAAHPGASVKEVVHVPVIKRVSIS